MYMFKIETWNLVFFFPVLILLYFLYYKQNEGLFNIYFLFYKSLLDHNYVLFGQT